MDFQSLQLSHYEQQLHKQQVKQGRQFIYQHAVPQIESNTDNDEIQKFNSSSTILDPKFRTIALQKVPQSQRQKCVICGFVSKFYCTICHCSYCNVQHLQQDDRTSHQQLCNLISKQYQFLVSDPLTKNDPSHFALHIANSTEILQTCKYKVINYLRQCKVFESLVVMQRILYNANIIYAKAEEQLELNILLCRIQISNNQLELAKQTLLQCYFAVKQFQQHQEQSLMEFTGEKLKNEILRGAQGVKLAWSLSLFWELQSYLFFKTDEFYNSKSAIAQAIYYGYVASERFSPWMIRLWLTYINRQYIEENSNKQLLIDYCNDGVAYLYYSHYWRFFENVMQNPRKGTEYWVDEFKLLLQKRFLNKYEQCEFLQNMSDLNADGAEVFSSISKELIDIMLYDVGQLSTIAAWEEYIKRVHISMLKPRIVKM